MPEHAELRLTADYVNQFADKFKCLKITKTEKTKQADPNWSDVEGKKIKAISRGKELKLVIEGHDKDLLMTMGMSGHFTWFKEGAIHKHTQMYCEGFGIKNGNREIVNLCFVDPRHFGKWKWVEKNKWGVGRGPDVSAEWETYKSHLNNITNKDASVPLNELLLNQNLFNGCGNYLRAHIISKLNVNPFATVNELLNSNDKFLSILAQEFKLAVEDAYRLNGGELHSWKNPLTSENVVENNKTFQQWIQAYGKGLNLVDRTGRRFWFDPIWKQHALNYVNKYNLIKF